MSRPDDPVLVTGANSGIGLAATLLLVERGWEVWGTVRSREKADTLYEAAEQACVEDQVRPLLLDVSDHDAVVEQWKDLPDFYAVVNNAGRAETGAIEEVSAARAKAQLDVNLVAPAVVSACALPAMRRRGSGRIVMISSIAGRAAMMPLNGWYHASKFGLEALSDILRVEVASFGVQVVIVEPGFFRTGIVESEKIASHIPPEEAASPYATAYQRTHDVTGWVERLAPEPGAVARTIADAIESRSPRRRYVVGLDALALVATQPFTPRPLTDLAMRLFGGLY